MALTTQTKPTFVLETWWQNLLVSMSAPGNPAAKRLRKCRPEVEKGKVTLLAPPEDIPWLEEHTTALINNTLRPYGLQVDYRPLEATVGREEKREEDLPEENRQDQVGVSLYYRSLREAWIRPDRIIRVPGYILRWWGVIRGSGLSLLTALYQVAYLHDGQGTASLQEVARWAGVSKRTVINSLSKMPFALFVETEERKGTHIRLPATPPLTPGDARELAAFLAPAPRENVEHVLAASPSEIRQILGPPATADEDVKNYDGYRASILRAALDFAQGPEKAAEVFAQMTAVVVRAFGDIVFPWYMLKFRDAVGHALFWYWVWRRQAKGPAPASAKEAAREAGVPRKTLSDALQKSPEVFIQALFPSGVFKEPAEMPLLPEDEILLWQWSERLAAEGQKALERLPEPLRPTAEKILAAARTEPLVPEAWNWQIFARLPIDASLQVRLKNRVQPAQFATALLLAGANPRTQNIIGLAIHLAESPEKLKPCQLSPAEFFEALQDVVRWERPRSVDGYEVTVKAARTLLEML